MEIYKPKHKIALVSLCCATKPFHNSRKWKEFTEHFGAHCDLIICSSGGVIPIEYDDCYPYLTYDVHAKKEYEKLYINTCYRRLMKFFDKFEYETIIFNFRPGLRNRIAAQAFKRDYKGKARIVILPTVEAYKEAQRAGFPAGKMFPDLDPRVLAEIEKAVKQ